MQVIFHVWTWLTYTLLAATYCHCYLHEARIILSWRSVHVVTYYFTIYAKYKYNNIIVRIMLHISWLNLFRYVINVIKHCVNFMQPM